MKVAQPIPAFAAHETAAPPGHRNRPVPAPQAEPIEKIHAFDPRWAAAQQGRDAAVQPTGTAVASPRDIVFFRLQAATLATGPGSVAFLAQQINEIWPVRNGPMDPVRAAVAYSRPVDMPPMVSLSA